MLRLLLLKASTARDWTNKLVKRMAIVTNNTQF